MPGKMITYNGRTRRNLEPGKASAIQERGSQPRGAGRGTGHCDESDLHLTATEANKTLRRPGCFLDEHGEFASGCGFQRPWHMFAKAKHKTKPSRDVTYRSTRD